MLDGGCYHLLRKPLAISKVFFVLCFCLVFMRFPVQIPFFPCNFLFEPRKPSLSFQAKHRQQRDDGSWLLSHIEQGGDQPLPLSQKRWGNLPTLLGTITYITPDWKKNSSSSQLPSGKLTCQWKVPFICSWKYIFNLSIFHCYVTLLECTF